MKKYTGILFVFLILFLSSVTVSADDDLNVMKGDDIYVIDKTYNVNEMYLSINDVEYAYSRSNGDHTLFTELLITIGTKNYHEKHSEFNDEFSIQSYYDGDQYNIFGRTLTGSEISLMIQYPFYVPSWIKASNTALSKTNELYSKTSDGSIANAFLHAYWNVLMVKKMNVSLAKKFATAHEDYNNNPTIHKDMDLFNNNVGRDFAEGISNLSSKSDSWLAQEVKSKLIEKGITKYILFNYSYLHYIIYFDYYTDFIYHNHDFYAYTNRTTPISVPDYEIIDLRGKIGPVPLFE